MATEFNPGGAGSLNAAVKQRYEANADTNAFTDAHVTKLDGVSTGAQRVATGTVTPYSGDLDFSGGLGGGGGQTDAEIKAAVLSEGLNLGELSDMEAGPPIEGEIPVYRSGVWTFEAKPAAGSNPAIADITDWPAGVVAAEVGYLDGVTSAIQTQLNAKAALASPTFTGTPLAPTQPTGNNSTAIATTAFVKANIDNTAYAVSWDGVTASAPSKNAVYDQIEVILTSLAAKAPLESPTFTGSPLSTTPPAGNNSTRIATTEFVQTVAANHVTSDTTEAGGGTAIGNIVEITQAAYDALGTPDADTLYIING